MSRPLAVLRPEPGNARTAVAIVAMGRRALRVPLFAVRPIAWTPPDRGDFDALLLTSANAVRHGGAGLAHLRGLPVLAVGAATAAAARAAGFVVAATGDAGVDALLADRAPARLLHLAGRERMPRDDVTAIAVYAADPLPIAAAALVALEGSVALLHSARAARALAALPLDRDRIRIAALSEAVAAAAGLGWDRCVAAASPDDGTLLALAATLAD